MRRRNKGCGLHAIFLWWALIGTKELSSLGTSMGVSVSTSLSKLKENPILLKFVDNSPIADGDDFWNELLSFSYSPPKSM